MSLLIGFLTFVLVMNCLVLMLLILIQLPKKEAGAGIAFGGAATDALFGAGSGNALTKITKYAGTAFVAMSLLLSVLHMNAAHRGSRLLDQELSKRANTGVTIPSVLPTNLNSQSVLPPAGTTTPAAPAAAGSGAPGNAEAPAAPAAPAPAPALPPVANP
jgi:protein translocase SecG subunit